MKKQLQFIDIDKSLRTAKTRRWMMIIISSSGFILAFVKFAGTSWYNQHNNSEQISLIMQRQILGAFVVVKESSKQ
ncbi:hypothetical protein EUGRSUZ_E02485 [Eucalyptus grandis]|uniref:Uncharacterized protein n=2 Tax=Eucalyptus grandis TaxID=71139 RepID=A0ACC3KWV6_EUCGR|nr:hypothetical protein EUGRSUZ_E02485 [Eucalyptus grandis]